MLSPTNLRDWDVIVINTSGGKDSQAMLDEMVTRAKAQGVLERVVLVHADLGRAEWDGTTEIVIAQAAAYGLENRLYIRARPQGDLVQQIRDRAATLKAKGSTAAAWPSNKTRYCTSDQKTGQCAVILTHLVGLVRAMGVQVDPSGPVRVLDCLGLRAQESSARAKKAEFKHSPSKSNGLRAVYVYHPILAWTEAEVWERIRWAGTPVHRAYSLGMPRLSCVFCVFAPKSALVIAAKHNPKLFAEYLDLETVAGDFRHGFSLTEVADALANGEADGVTAADAAGWNM